MHEQFLLRGMSAQTEDSYLQALRMFLSHHENREIETMGEREIREFLLHQINWKGERLRDKAIFKTVYGAGLHLSVAASGGIAGSIAYVGQNANLLTELQLIAEANGLGLAVDFSTAGFTFRVYAGRDRTAGQSINPRAIFSKAFENVLKQEYDGSLKAVKNVACVDAIYTVTRTVFDKKTETDVEITTEYPLSRTVGTATGRSRREVYVDAGDVTKDEAGTTLNAAQRYAAMDDAGTAEMVSATEAFTADVDQNGNLRYKADYDLGDIVTVDSRELSMRVNARITEIKKVYEGKGLSLALTLGYGIPSFSKQVRWLANG